MTEGTEASGVHATTVSSKDDGDEGNYHGATAIFRGGKCGSLSFSRSEFRRTAEIQRTAKIFSPLGVTAGETRHILTAGDVVFMAAEIWPKTLGGR